MNREKIKVICNNQLETMRLAKKVISLLPNSAIVLLYGEIGAGKTTFIKYCIEEQLNKEFVTSPTFNIVNIYKTKDHSTILHLDLYRIKSYTELYDLGIEGFFNKAMLFIEWPEPFIKAFNPVNIYEIHIKSINENSREFCFKGFNDI